MKTLTKEWLAQAQYDLETARAMLKTGRYLYVAFMCQQAIEKLMKGIIQERTDKTPPYSHRLDTLLNIVELPVDSKKESFLGLLTRYYINCRYPEHKKSLSGFLNKKSSGELLKKTKEIFEWLKKESEISKKF